MIRYVAQPLWIALVVASIGGANAQPPAKPQTLDALLAAVDTAPLRRTGRDLYRPLIAREAQRRGLPLDLADAVAHVETGYDPNAIGLVGEIGLMQIRPQTAAMLGYRGDLSGLREPQTNVRFAVDYLTRAWQLAHGDLCRTLMKYRAGWGEETMTPKSVEYCRRARDHLASIGSPLAEGMADIPMIASDRVTRPALLASYGLRALHMRIRTASDSRQFWAAHDARVRAITARLRRARPALFARAT